MPDRNTSPASLPREERLLRSRLHQLLSRAEGFLHGSVIEMARRCGNPRCRCASDDKYRHHSLYLGQTREGKTTMHYIPKDQESTVRRWAGDFQRAAAYLEDLSQQGRNRLSEAKADKSAAKKAVAKKKKAPQKKAAHKKKKPAAGKARKKKTTRKPPPKPS
jgi:hypothetical protein